MIISGGALRSMPVRRAWSTISCVQLANPLTQPCAVFSTRRDSGWPAVEEMAFGPLADRGEGFEGDVKRVTGRDPIRFDQFAKENVGAFRG